jgi:hypothetical protein
VYGWSNHFGEKLITIGELEGDMIKGKLQNAMNEVSRFKTEKTVEVKNNYCGALPTSNINCACSWFACLQLIKLNGDNDTATAMDEAFKANPKKYEDVKFMKVDKWNKDKLTLQKLLHPYGYQLRMVYTGNKALESDKEKWLQNESCAGNFICLLKSSAGGATTHSVGLHRNATHYGTIFDHNKVYQYSTMNGLRNFDMCLGKVQCSGLEMVAELKAPKTKKSSKNKKQKLS